MRQVCKPKKKAILELKLNGQKPEQMHSVRQSNIIIEKIRRKKYNSSQGGSFHGDIDSLATGQGITSLQGSEQKSRCFSDFSNRLSTSYFMTQTTSKLKGISLLLPFCINDRMHHHTRGVRVNHYFFCLKLSTTTYQSMQALCRYIE